MYVHQAWHNPPCRTRKVRVVVVSLCLCFRRLLRSAQNAFPLLQPREREAKQYMRATAATHTRHLVRVWQDLLTVRYGIHTQRPGFQNFFARRLPAVAAAKDLHRKVAAGCEEGGKRHLFEYATSSWASPCLGEVRPVYQDY